MPPRRGCGRHLKITSERKNTDIYNERKTKNQGENNKQAKAQSTLQVAAAVCGTSSIASFSLLARLAPCYPVPSPSCVRQLCPAPWRYTIPCTKQANQARHPPAPHDSFHKAYPGIHEPHYHLWGQNTLIISSLSPKRHWGPKRDNEGGERNENRNGSSKRKKKKDVKEDRNPVCVCSSH